MSSNFWKWTNIRVLSKYQRSRRELLGRNHSLQRNRSYRARTRARTRAPGAELLVSWAFAAVSRAFAAVSRAFTARQ